ncbi:hypothetical protein Daura_13230 [Dactylosporangium aurantiacum]|uniref:Uncharacterized protein n=1 Tax=Dactylosporangium aurantiacum TaxID=35754 RepID=A0A9Q9MHR8_9ACTN|nr:hypothetical protein [Dactylosporangium aurantiacum]MDG6105627.1 hypothetical protein [Dactylosporangium aurantiacum]UWZ57039.1 hypothetical protein Daura_13230 [Dactylosporangium aurantiacum]
MDEQIRDDEFRAVQERYRRADEELLARIGERVDLDDLLLRVKNSERFTHEELTEVVATWQAQLAAGVRGGQAAYITPVDDRAVFTALVGRAPERLEAWPELHAGLHDGAWTVSLWLPAFAGPGVRAVAFMVEGPASASVELTVSPDDDGVELTGSMPAAGLTGNPVIGVRVTGVR